MITDLVVADHCEAIYSNPQTILWTHFEESLDLTWGMVRIDDTYLIINRGSKSRNDWMIDAEAYANPLIHRGLGPVHTGFMRGMENQWAIVKTIAKQAGITQVKFGGHSLGAAHATLLTGIAILDGWMPFPRCVFGEPMSTFQQGADIVARSGGNSYRNGNKLVHDPVCSVPVRFWPELYVHATRMIEVCSPPTALDNIPKEWHHMPLYQLAVRARGETNG